MDVFDAADKLVGGGYRVQVATPGGRDIRSENGLRLRADFAVEGALAAHALATEHGYPLADTLAEAITLHLNVAVPADLGPEAHLLHAGAGMDVAGLRAGLLPRRARSEVLTRHPRDGFAAEVEVLLARQAEARPRSRIALLRQLGFADLIRRGERRLT
jgi:hypothetical protein